MALSNRTSTSGIYVLWLLLIATLVAGCETPAPSEQAILENAYKRLDRLRDEKEEQLYDYFDHVERLVQSVHEDHQLVEAFTELRSHYHGTASSEARTIGELEEAIRERYLDTYQIFYDVHFIDRAGDVFYSIRKQGDLFRNVFDGELSSWQLSHTLSSAGGTAAVDFHFADFSSEPSAFFAEPIADAGTHVGWIVLQFASARLAEVFEYDANLGLTGEVFLVNEKHFMLTQSAHTAGSSVLTQTLSVQNIESKFAIGEGHKIVVDYRGYEALSSFTVCEIMGFRWLLIAKIDRAEVLTEAYLERESDYYPKLRDELRRTPVAVRNVEPAVPTRVVHLDRFERITESGSLFTPGVSTCTAIIVSLPGEFAYMAHISPYDVAYGGRKTDLIHTVLRRIRSFEVPDSKVRELEVTVVTPRIRYTESIIHELAETGILLSQITFLKNPQARCADVSFDFDSNRTTVLWCYGEEYRRTEVQVADDARDLAEVFSSIL